MRCALVALAVWMPWVAWGFTPATPLPEVNAPVAVVMDAQTGEFLFAKNADERRQVASTQKLLTALMVVEGGDLDGEFLVERSDTQVIPVKLNLRAADSYTRRALLKVLLVRSANDVAMALARDHSGSVERFVERMNQTAWSLGLLDSKFKNPSGLPDQTQFSTAADMARLARVCYGEPLIRELVAMKEMEFTFASGKTTTIKNTNRVLHSWEHCNGMKTGYVDASGHCLISSGSANGRDVIVVLLGSNRREIWQESYQLLAWGLGFRIEGLR